MTKDELYEFGYFTKLHGFRGELTAHLNTIEQRDYKKLPSLFVEVRGQLVPYTVKSLDYKTNTSVKVKLEGIETEEAAKALVKCGLYIEDKYLSEADKEKMALREIVDYKVIDEERGEIGIVSHIEELSNNPLLVIKSGTKEILMPLHEDFFKSIDRPNKTVYISAPEGLIDFYLEQ